MKYLLVMISGIFFSISAHALCPFMDQFTLQSPAGIKILNAKVAGNLHYENQGDRNFALSCASDDVNNSGYLYIDIGYNYFNKCNLVIHDGPYVMNPTVTSLQCGGKISYAGIYHHFGSNQYVLKFID